MWTQRRSRPTGEGPPVRRPRAVVRRYAAALLALALLVAASPAAIAGPDTRPQVVTADTFETDITFPFEYAPGEFDQGPCDFDGVHLDEVVTVRQTVFFDRDGEFSKETLHVHATTVWTGPDGASATEHWAWNGTRTEDGDTVTFAENGNFWNVHQPGGGVVLHEKGRHVITVGPDGFDFEVIGGPHELGEVGTGPLCDAIAPATG